MQIEILSEKQKELLLEIPYRQKLIFEEYDQIHFYLMR